MATTTDSTAAEVLLVDNIPTLFRLKSKKEGEEKRVFDPFEHFHRGTNHEYVFTIICEDSDEKIRGLVTRETIDGREQYIVHLQSGQKRWEEVLEKYINRGCLSFKYVHNYETGHRRTNHVSA